MSEVHDGGLTAEERWSLIADIHQHGGSQKGCGCEDVADRVAEFVAARVAAAEQVRDEALGRIADALVDYFGHITPCDGGCDQYDNGLCSVALFFQGHDDLRAALAPDADTTDGAPHA